MAEKKKPSPKKKPKASAKPKKKSKVSAKPKKEAPERVYFFDSPKNVQRVIYALIAVCVTALGLEFVVKRYVDHPWEGLFGFYALYGFVMCVFLVLSAKELRKVLMRKEDYYDE